MTTSDDKRFERFKELSDGMARIQKFFVFALFMSFAVILGLGSIFTKGLSGHHWLVITFVVCLILSIFVLCALASYFQKRLCLKLNVYCPICKKAPIPAELPVVIATQACTRCGTKLEVENNEPPKHGLGCCTPRPQSSNHWKSDANDPGASA